MEPQRDLPLGVFKPHVQTYAVTEIDSGDYDLVGHGYLNVYTDEIEDESVHYLQVESVIDAQVLLRSRMRMCNNFEKQRGSVIVWCDSEQRQHHDLAISFETPRECDVIWRLICEKIGKNYLEISGRETLNLPNEHNLPYILEKTRTAKDMVEYNILNNPNFGQALVNVFQVFRQRQDKMGMGMMSRIIKSIFTNVDYRMVYALFRDPVFDLILQVQKFSKDVDYPRMWREKAKIRSLLPLDNDLTTKIHLVHRLNFYRQNNIDFKTEPDLQTILVMTAQDFCKEIVIHLTKEKTLEELIRLAPQELHEKQKEGEEETLISRAQEDAHLQLAEQKMEFILEALILARQTGYQNVKTRFYDRVFKSGCLQLASSLIEKGVTRALDFLVCLSQLMPAKFVQFLKSNYRESPADNLHTKLSRQFCLGSDLAQQQVLELIKNLVEAFKLKENLDFFVGTFFASVFSCCKEPRPVLALLAEMLCLVEKAEPLLLQAIKNKVLTKTVVFLRNQRIDKRSELNAVKVLKRILQQNADQSWSFRRAFLDQVNAEAVDSGLFDYSMGVLLRNLHLNNVISSSMLGNLKAIRQLNRFTSYHREIQNNYRQVPGLAPFLSGILQVRPQEQLQAGDSIFQQQRQQQIEQEREEAYLMEDNHQAIEAEQMDPQVAQQLRQLRSLTREMAQDIVQQQQLRSQQPVKKVKPNQQLIPEFTIDLPFDEGDEEGDK